ncbi:hypothetical protein [Euzebyella saccharophila]|uniref:Uncharacterized protein n=1 Tax=Euzebyella saccharophila TaxID=679664 RepID=A0ABV8JI68_9FLAO|nr:hypothetical protein [Euzebyella saccharophila]
MVLKKSVLVFLEVKDEEWNKMVDSLNGGQIANGNVNGENFQFDVGGILDEFGNVINEGKLEEYNQFREFFVQETQMGFIIPSQELLMKKDKPFFDKEQPLVLFPDIGGYWMNTPLKPLEENSLKK